MHEGHRERLYAKFIEGDASLTELETTEFLLCFSIARMDVKPIAAKLLENFGSLDGIFGATPGELKKVKGVGNKTAAFFKVMGDIIRSHNPARTEEKKPNVYNTVMFFREYFKNVESEQLVVAFLGKNGEVIRKFIYTDYSRSEINVNLKEIAAEIARIAPHSAVMAHNHFSGNVHPSLADDLTTRRIALMMNVHGVIFYDHLIFCGDEYYSYHITGRLDKIKEEINAAVR